MRVISTKTPSRPFAGLLLLFVWLVSAPGAKAQRNYKPSSVLASGTWYKISTTSAGVYKIDVPFLNSLGFGGSVPSSQIRLFGRTTGMLPEANAEPRLDDLEEIAVSVEDGGDGVLNGNDYLLFYSPSPDEWKKIRRPGDSRT